VLHGIPPESGVFSDVKTNSKTRRLKGSAELQWKYALELYGWSPGSGLFTGTVTTDGVTVNPHLSLQDAEELQAIKDAKDASAKAHAE
jgi:hypothetical protein